MIVHEISRKHYSPPKRPSCMQSYDTLALRNWVDTQNPCVFDFCVKIPTEIQVAGTIQAMRRIVTASVKNCADISCSSHRGGYTSSLLISGLHRFHQLQRFPSMMQYNQQSTGKYYSYDRKEPKIFVARWLSKSSHEKEIDNSKLSTSPLNQQATNAIISQLSSPANILTMSRILATPFLSYMLISEHSRKTNDDSSSVLSETGSSSGGAAQISDVATSEAATTTLDAVTTISTTNLGDQISTTPAIALSLFLIMAFTDFLDGHIARTYPTTATVLGTYLDPFADKFFISTLSCTLCYTGTLPGMLVGLWVVRDVGVFGSAYWMVRQETLRNNQNSSDSNIAVMDPLNTPLKVQASLMSKVNTTLQIGLIALGIAGDVPTIHIPPELMTSLIWVTAGTTIVSTLGYLDGSALRNSGNR